MVNLVRSLLHRLGRPTHTRVAEDTVAADADRRIALEALENAGRLYDRYLELSDVTKVNVEGTDEEPVDWDCRSWDHPMGVTIRPGSGHAIVE